MRSVNRHAPLDPLYGRLDFPDAILELRHLPVLQRLRHVRLSNIDSIDLPGIANLSRYEHSLGTCHLAGKMPMLKKVPEQTALIIQAAALLHDWAIPPFGHLVEEAAQYLSTELNHEIRLLRQQNPMSMDIGGTEQQILYGRETGITKWLTKVFGTDWQERERQLASLILGKGRFGRCISGSVDVDNLDNVTRIAFHMGLNVKRDLGEKIATCIIDDDKSGNVIFRHDVLPLLEDWVQLRREVYQHLMLSPSDFVGKIMIIFATYRAFEEQSIDASIEWKRNDLGFLQALLKNDVRDVKETIERWMVGDFWDASELWWMEGDPPPFRAMKSLGNHVSETLDRTFFAYRISDKRNRLHNIELNDGSTVQLGSKPSEWLLGFASSKRGPLSAEVNRQLFSAAAKYLNVQPRYRALENIEPSFFDL